VTLGCLWIAQLWDDGWTTNNMVGSNASASKSIVIVVLAVNQAPSFSLPNKAVALAVPRSYTPLRHVIRNFTTQISSGSPEEDKTQRVTFTVTAVAGSLSFTRAPEVAQDGTLTFTLARGSGGNQSAPLNQHTMTVPRHAMPRPYWSNTCICLRYRLQDSEHVKCLKLMCVLRRGLRFIHHVTQRRRRHAQQWQGRVNTSGVDSPRILDQ
jgi:hypothetical protein